MKHLCMTVIVFWSLPPRGAWIEIFFVYNNDRQLKRRSPRGERGLKSLRQAASVCHTLSLPPRGAWIEICTHRTAHCLECRSPRGERGLKCEVPPIISAEPGRSPRGERGLKYRGAQEPASKNQSLPPRGAWIEIATLQSFKDDADVAPPAGSVD